MRNYEDLEVWRRAHAHVLRMYRVTCEFPPEEQFVLVPQIRRCGVSVAANIVEGADRPSDAQFAQYLDFATGSAAELDYYWRLAQDLGYLTPELGADLRRDTRAIRRQIFALTRYLRARPRGR